MVVLREDLCSEDERDQRATREVSCCVSAFVQVCVKHLRHLFEYGGDTKMYKLSDAIHAKCISKYTKNIKVIVLTKHKISPVSVSE